MYLEVPKIIYLATETDMDEEYDTYLSQDERKLEGEVKLEKKKLFEELVYILKEKKDGKCLNYHL